MDSSIKSMRVRSAVVSRFARVVVESTMLNDQATAREMKFSVKLPKTAFITEFKMIVSGKTIHGEVKEKAIAAKQYQRAVAAGRSGGLVSAKVRDAQDFDISTNVPANSSVEFHLVYLELLQRRLGTYDHVILVNPGQVIDDFSIEVKILENSGITYLQGILPTEKENPREEISTESLTSHLVKNKKFGKVCFRPTAQEQRKILSLPINERKVTIRYEVNREVLGGEIHIRNGYFVHFFAPKNLPILPKRVVFAIDQSGSMAGQKISQTKKAFVSVLKELRENDRFNVVTFSNDVDIWKMSWADNNLLPTTEKNIKDAVEYVEEISPFGGTNLSEGLNSGAKLLELAKREDVVASMMIMLTDGQATCGITSNLQIRSTIQNRIQGRFSIFTLGFGRDVDDRFLRRLADENGGIYRKIYADSDADLQLKGFFEEVASPLLLNVKISYLGTSVLNTSKIECDQYFDGSELVVVGQVSEGAESLNSSTTAFTTESEVEYKAEASEMSLSGEEFDFSNDFENFIEKIWAYYTIKELLHKKEVSDADQPSVDKRILELALKYKFVTPHTSMVVTNPEDHVPVPPMSDLRAVNETVDTTIPRPPPSPRSIHPGTPNDLYSALTTHSNRPLSSIAPPPTTGYGPPPPSPIPPIPYRTGIPQYAPPRLPRSRAVQMQQVQMHPAPHIPTLSSSSPPTRGCGPPPPPLELTPSLNLHPGTPNDLYSALTTHSNRRRSSIAPPPTTGYGPPPPSPIPPIPYRTGIPQYAPLRSRLPRSWAAKMQQMEMHPAPHNPTLSPSPPPARGCGPPPPPLELTPSLNLKHRVVSVFDKHHEHHASSKHRKKNEGTSPLSKEIFSGTLTDSCSGLKLPHTNFWKNTYRWIIVLKSGSWIKFKIEIPEHACVKITILGGKDAAGSEKLYDYEGEGPHSEEVLVKTHICTIKISVLNSYGAHVAMKYEQV